MAKKKTPKKPTKRQMTYARNYLMRAGWSSAIVCEHYCRSNPDFVLALTDGTPNRSL